MKAPYFLKHLFGSLFFFVILFVCAGSIVPSRMLVILVLARTYLEDNTLISWLAGYDAYAETTRFRMFPYIW